MNRRSSCGCRPAIRKDELSTGSTPNEVRFSRSHVPPTLPPTPRVGLGISESAALALPVSYGISLPGILMTSAVCVRCRSPLQSPPNEVRFSRPHVPPPLPPTPRVGLDISRNAAISLPGILTTSAVCVRGRHLPLPQSPPNEVRFPAWMISLCCNYCCFVLLHYHVIAYAQRPTVSWIANPFHMNLTRL